MKATIKKKLMAHHKVPITVAKGANCSVWNIGIDLIIV
jgi:hypothetical protein